MKKVFKSIVVAGLVLGGTTAAQAADLSILFTNTVEMTATYKEIPPMVTKLQYNEDGSVKIISAQGESTGSWAVNGAEMCTTMASPQGQQMDMCNPVADMEGASVGDSWEFSPADGLNIKGALIAGR